MYFNGNSQIKMDLYNSKVMKIIIPVSLFYSCDHCFFLSSVVQKTAGEIQNKPNLNTFTQENLLNHLLIAENEQFDINIL